MTDHQEFVYLIGPVHGSPVTLCKIGHAQDPWSRLALFQTGSPIELVILALAPGGRRVERRMHSALSLRRVRREWFDLGDDPLELFWLAYRGRKIAPPTENDTDDSVPFQPASVVLAEQRTEEIRCLISDRGGDPRAVPLGEIEARYGVSSSTASRIRSQATQGYA